MADTQSLIEKIKELESELHERERDLAVFREELTKANTRIEKLIDQVNKELQIAQKVQKKLLPTEIPSIPGFEFSTKFKPSPISGSDYFDIFEHENRMRFGVLLANSSGYGLTALFLSVLLKMTSALEARRGLSPNAMLQSLCVELLPQIKSGEYANTFYGIMDRSRYTFEYCNVGRITALHQRANDSQLLPLEPQYDPMGSESQPQFEARTISIQPKDRIILCSEGLRVVKNLKGELFGRERLFKAIFEGPKQGVHELRNEILYRIEKFSQGEPLPKDITLIIIEANSNVIKLA